MAIHSNILSMVNETLPEYLTAAEQCVNHVKPDGGCLGYAAALLLFAIADAIGSFYRGNEQFTVRVDNTLKPIKIADHHFRILNSGFYGLNLSGEQIKQLIVQYRNPLSHNSLLLPDTWLDLGHADTIPFEFKPVGGSRNPDWRVPFVHLRSFLKLSQKAVSEFLKAAPSIVPGSKQAEEMMKKADAIAYGGDR